MSKRRRGPRGKSSPRRVASPAAGMSIAAFARDRKVDEKAVRKAIASGRLSRAVLGRSSTGRRVTIADPEAARREWIDNAGQAPRVEAPAVVTPAAVLEAPIVAGSDPLAARLAAMRAERAAASAATSAPAPAAAVEAPRAVGKPGSTLMDAQRRVTLERGRKLKLENDRRAGELVEVAIVAREAFDASRIIREAVLNLPARIAAELAAMTDAHDVYVRLDEALRAILSETAEALANGTIVDDEEGKEGSGG